MTGSLATGPGDSVLPVPTRPRGNGATDAVGVRRPLETAVEVTVPAGASFAAVGRMVLAGVGARTGLRVREIEDLQQAMDLLVTVPAVHDEVTIRLTPSPDGMEVDVGPLAIRPVDRWRLERALDVLVEEVGWHDVPGGAWISTRMSRRSVDRSRR